MKRIIWLFCLLMFMLLPPGCHKKVAGEGIVGKWKGSVLIVNVEFVFEPDSYIQKTTSFNDVQIGGTRGKIEIKGNTIFVDQTHKYFFDNDTNRGEWRESPAKYTIDYKIEGNSVKLHPSTSEDSMVLERAE